MKQTRFCTCESGVTRCQSQQQNEVEVRCVLHRQVSLAAVNQIDVFMRLYLNFQIKPLMDL